MIDVVSSTREHAGLDVYLTSTTLQANVESLLRKAERDWGAVGASAIVLDPRTGGVLAMANAPTFDANDFPKIWAPHQRNDTVEGTYEPGSTFKVVTVRRRAVRRPGQPIDVVHAGAVDPGCRP